MKVLGFLEAAAAPITFIAHQAAAWGSHTFVVLAANPATVVITCIALAAIGTMAYMYKARAREWKAQQAAFQKQLETANALQKTMQGELAQIKDKLNEKTTAAPSVPPAALSTIDALYLKSLPTTIGQLTTQYQKLAEEKNNLKTQIEQILSILEKGENHFVSIDQQQHDLEEKTGLAIQKEHESTEKRANEIEGKIKTLQNLIGKAVEVNKIFSKRIDDNNKDVLGRVEATKQAQGLMKQEITLLSKEFSTRVADLNQELDKRLKLERNLTVNEINSVKTICNAAIAVGEKSAKGLKKMVDDTKTDLQTDLRHQENILKEFVQKRYEHLYHKTKELEQQTGRPRSKSSPTKVETPAKAPLTPIKEVSEPSTPYKTPAKAPQMPDQENSIFENKTLNKIKNQSANLVDLTNVPLPSGVNLNGTFKSSTPSKFNSFITTTPKK